MGPRTFYSCRARFGSQSPYCVLEPHGTLGSGDLMSSPTFEDARQTHVGTYTYEGKILSHIK